MQSVMTIYWIHLFVHCIAVSKYEITSQKAGYESVCLALLAAIDPLLQEQEPLVQRDELGEIDSVLLGGSDDCPQARLPADKG